jgi:hypothetical protein
MVEIKEPEEAVRIMEDVLRFLANVKVKAELPIPVKKDRLGKATKDYTLRYWWLKEQEEFIEFYSAASKACSLDEMPSEKNRTAQMYANREEILEEACDQIHTIFSKLHQFGYSEDDIAVGIRRSNEKARERGLID